MTGVQRVKVTSCLLVAFTVQGVNLRAAESHSSAGSVKCSFKADPDAFLARESRTRRDVFDRAAKFNGRSASTQARYSVPVSEIPIRNLIDEEIFGRLAQVGAPSARLTTDEEFVRRIYLDLTGRVPTVDQYRSFVDDSAPNKREVLIDRLLFSQEYLDRWTMWLGDLVQNNVTSANFNQQIDGRNSMYKYLRVALFEERSMRDIAWELINGLGNNYDNGPANFAAKWTTPGGPVQDRYDTALVRSTSAFLGISHYDCVLCHDGRNHLDQISLWGKSTTRLEAYRMAAFFSRVDVRGRANVAGNFYNNSTDVTERATGTYDLNTNFGNRPNRVGIGSIRNVTPEYRNGQAPAMNANWRALFADQITADPMFARNITNRLWKAMFNLALVEPVDGLDPTRLDPDNPPPSPWTFQTAHPVLLDRLARHFRNSNFNMRETLRLIAESSAYQLSSRYDGEWKMDYVPLFGRHYPRRLDGEEVHDALVQATGVFQNYVVQNMEEQFRWAGQLPDTTEPRNNLGGATTFMNVFLRGNRDTQPRSQAGSVLQQLTLMNSTFVLDRIRMNSSPTLRESAKITNNRDLIYDLYLRFLARLPDETEATRAEAHLARATNATQRNSYIEDMAWALVNKLEFIFSY